MRAYNHYIITLAVVLLGTAVVMVGLDAPLNIQYTVYFAEVLAVTEIFRYFSPQARRALQLLSISFFAIFLASTALMVIRML